MAHALVGRIFRVSVPYRGRTRTFFLRILTHSLSWASGEVVRIRTFGTMDVPSLMRWVTVEEFSLLVAVGLAVPITTMPCAACGDVMGYHPDGEVDNRPQSFFACTGCEHCVVV